MVLSDFCMSPTEYAVNLLEPGSTRDMVSYYSTCSGTDPVVEYLSDANAAVAAMDDLVNTLLGGSCQGDQEMLYVQGNLSLANATLIEVETLSQCGPYYNQANDLLHNAVCFNLFTGFYIAWVCQYVISGGVFLLLLVSTMIYQFFGPYWYMEQADLDNMVNSLEERLLPPEDNSSTLQPTIPGHEPSPNSGAQVTSPGAYVYAPLSYDSPAGVSAPQVASTELSNDTSVSPSTTV